MKKALLEGVVVLLSPWVSIVAMAQGHPPVLEKVPETAARGLYEELGQGKKILVIDVRSPKEYAEGNIPGAINIPIEELSKKISEMGIAKGTKIVTVCDRGGRSSRAAAELRKLGFSASSFCKLDSWKKEGYKTESETPRRAPVSKVHKFTCHHYCQAEKETPDLETQCECACNKPYRDCTQGN